MKLFLTICFIALLFSGLFLQLFGDYSYSLYLTLVTLTYFHSKNKEQI